MNTQEEMIRSAVEAIGPDDADDWSITPSRFSENVASPELAGALSHSSLTETARRYEKRDAEAVEIQKSFKSYSHRATWLVFAATTAAALLAGLQGFIGPEAKGLARLSLASLGFCSLLAGAWAAIVLYLIGNEQLLQRWMTARAAAESARLDYFEKLTNRLAAGPSNPGLLLLGLEFFRRYQLAVQLRYYEGRGRQHRLSQRKTLRVGAIAVGLLSLGSGGLGVAGALVDEKLLPLAALGIIGAGLATVASRREELNQDGRNSERYGRTSDTLSHISEQHSDVQVALANGEAEVLLKYVGAVHDQLSLEHRQWLSDSDNVNSAIGQLRKALEGQRKDEAES